jgi:nicotinamide mononucleotide transporter
MLHKKAKALLIDYLPVALLAPAIVAGGVLAKQAAYKIIPAVASLFIVLLASKLYRVSFLLGAANCLLYSAGYFMEGLYGSLLSTLAVGAPLQVISWFLWKRSSYKQATVFRRLRRWHYPLLAVGIAALWAGILYGSARVGGANGMIVLDSCLFALGLAVTVLTMFAFVEGYALNILACALTAVMWGVLTVRNTRDVTYLLISLYNLYRVCLALANCARMYRAQQREKTEQAKEALTT